MYIGVNLITSGIQLKKKKRKTQCALIKKIKSEKKSQSLGGNPELEWSSKLLEMKLKLT